MNRFVIITIVLVVIQIISGVVATQLFFRPLVGIIDNLTNESPTPKQTQGSVQKASHANKDINEAAIVGTLVAALLSSVGILTVSINRVRARTQKQWAWILLIIYSILSILSSTAGLFISGHFIAMYRDLMTACIPGM